MRYRLCYRPSSSSTFNFKREFKGSTPWEDRNEPTCQAVEEALTSTGEFLEDCGFDWWVEADAG